MSKLNRIVQTGALIGALSAAPHALADNSSNRVEDIINPNFAGVTSNFGDSRIGELSYDRFDNRSNQRESRNQRDSQTQQNLRALNAISRLPIFAYKGQVFAVEFGPGVVNGKVTGEASIKAVYGPLGAIVSGRVGANIQQITGTISALIPSILGIPGQGVASLGASKLRIKEKLTFEAPVDWIPSEIQKLWMQEMRIGVGYNHFFPEGNIVREVGVSGFHYNIPNKNPWLNYYVRPDGEEGVWTASAVGGGKGFRARANFAIDPSIVGWNDARIDIGPRVTLNKYNPVLDLPGKSEVVWGIGGKLTQDFQMIPDFKKWRFAVGGYLEKGNQGTKRKGLDGQVKIPLDIGEFNIEGGYGRTSGTQIIGATESRNEWSVRASLNIPFGGDSRHRGLEPLFQDTRELHGQMPLDRVTHIPGIHEPYLSQTPRPRKVVVASIANAETKHIGIEVVTTDTSITCTAGDIQDKDGVRNKVFTLYNGGKEVQKSTTVPCSFSGLESGLYDIILSAETYNPVTRTWELHQLSKTNIKIELNKPPENLTFTALPNLVAPLAIGTNIGTVSAVDPEGKTLTYKITGSSLFGISGGNQVVVSSIIQAGNYNFTLEVSDGKNTVTKPFTVTVNQPVNHAPEFNGIVGDKVRTLGDFINDVLPDAKDIDGDNLTYSMAGDAVPGINFTASTRTVSGQFTKAGTYNVLYKVSDGKGGTTEQKITVTVKEKINNAPTPTFTSFETPYQGTYTGNLTATDPENDALTYAKVSNPSHGTLSINSNGSFTYVPTNGYSGSDSFTYSVSDGKNTVNQNVTVTVKVNHAPVFDSSLMSFTVEVGSPGYAILPGATDSDGDKITYSILGDTVPGITFDSPTHTVNGTYTTAGVYNVTYRASDGKGGIADQNITITVNSANTAPTGGNGSIDLNYTGTGLFTLSLTDKETPNDLFVQFLQLPAHGKVLIGGSPVTTGVKYSSNSTFTYQVTVGTGFNGDDSLQWKGFDKQGLPTSQAYTEDFLNVADR